MPHTCRNPECGKEIQEGMNYCGEDCFKRHIELKKLKKEQESEEPSKNPEVEEILSHIGVSRETTSKKIAYEHWYRFVELALKMNGKNWQTVRSMMRSYVNVDFRYIDDYLKCLTAWGIFSVNNSILNFHGIPKEVDTE